MVEKRNLSQGEKNKALAKLGLSPLEGHVESVCGCCCDSCRHTPTCCLGIYCGSSESSVVVDYRDETLRGTDANA